MQKKRIAVIGAGVLGLSVARALAISGADVTLFERQHIGAGTSSTTFAWVNANGKQPESYYQLNVAAMQEHVALQEQAQTEGQWLIRSGTYEWATDEKAKARLVKRVASLQALNYRTLLLTRAQITQRVPEIRLDPRADAFWHFPEECLLHPAIFLAWLWSEARRCGAKLNNFADVVDIQENESGVSLALSDGSCWQGDQLVIATGRWSQELMACLDLKLALIDASQANKIACGFLAVTAPLFTQLSANLISPQLNVRPDGGGRLLLQAPDLDYCANPAAPATVQGYVGQEMLNRLRRLFDNSESAKIEHIAVGQRARPADGLPGIGYVTPHKRTYLMVTHSGMTLGPLLGRLAAHEMLTGQRAELLHDFSPERLLGKSAQDFPAFSTLHFPAAQ
ncbi:FAD-binding oxidoreductase [Pantoea sp. S62]|uniref:NAD(P)/FAD-dependent oxidoreductase n=1 Tax=Pantoea sp. S62 TaxID=2769342 RepID=UPI0019123420|nr:FAD-binding oxidoreductase [Pantoea sp. S62]MBK5016713.1 FAD-dependent oxidoreductase [Pantoea sp. S62]